VPLIDADLALELIVAVAVTPPASSGAVNVIVGLVVYPPAGPLTAAADT
jgi:hypothetical protein